MSAFSTLADLHEAAKLHGFEITSNKSRERFDIEGHGMTGYIEWDCDHFVADITLSGESWGVPDCFDSEEDSAIVWPRTFLWMTDTEVGHPAEIHFPKIQSLLTRMSVRMLEFFTV